MNKNYNYDDTLIDPSINSGDTTRIDYNARPNVGTDENETVEFTDYSDEAPEGPRKSSNKCIIAASAGIALAGGTAAAYGLGAFDPAEDPNVIAEAVNEGEVELDEEVAEVANPSLGLDFTIGSDENVKSLGISITVPESFDEIRLTTVPTDDMSFSQAFAAARRAVGPHGVFEWRGGVYGTYYDNEWKHMPADYKRNFSNHDWRSEMSHMGEGEVSMSGSESVEASISVSTSSNDGDVIIQETKVSQSSSSTHNTINIVAENNGGDYNEPTLKGYVDGDYGFDYSRDDVLIATAPSDDMDFETAFNIARAEVGPGGVFEWHGKSYNTFYEEEWNALSDNSKETFDGYDWLSEIEKAQSQPEDLYWSEVEVVDDEILAEIPVDPTTGQSIDEIAYAESEGYPEFDDNHIYGDANSAETAPSYYEPVSETDNANLYAAEPGSYAQTDSYTSDNAETGDYYVASSYDDEVEILNEDLYQTTDDVYVAEVIENDNPAIIEGDFYIAEVADVPDPVVAEVEPVYEPEPVIEPDVYEAPIVDDYSEPAVDDYSDLNCV